MNSCCSKRINGYFLWWRVELIVPCCRFEWGVCMSTLVHKWNFVTRLLPTTILAQFSIQWTADQVGALSSNEGESGSGLHGQFPWCNERWTRSRYPHIHIAYALLVRFGVIKKVSPQHANFQTVIRARRLLHVQKFLLTSILMDKCVISMFPLPSFLYMRATESRGYIEIEENTDDTMLGT
jgi:hypothetical protein